MSAQSSLTSTRALLNVVVLAFLGGVLVAIWLVAHDGWRYYTTPLAVRGYEKVHRFLRPSGEGGHLLGVAGTLFLFGTLTYVARRRLRILGRAGRVTHWLEAHIFCGVFGPILITYHTSFKFNGVVSVAYWSMVLVMASGFVGRYLYVRIPKTLRGEELSRAELDARAAELETRLSNMNLPVRLEGAARLRRQLRAAGLDRKLLREVVDLAKEREVLLRRIARLEKTRRLFQLWHVFHRPLVWVMFFVFFIHLGVAVYFGYTTFGG